MGRVSTDENALPLLFNVAKTSDNQLARLHSIWGIGQITRTTSKRRKQTGFIPLLLLPGSVRPMSWKNSRRIC